MSDDPRLHKPARVDFPDGGRGTIFAVSCVTCGVTFVPVERTSEATVVRPHLSVVEVDCVCSEHNGHALTYYAVLDDGEQVSGPMKVWAPWAKARKDAVMQ